MDRTPPSLDQRILDMALGRGLLDETTLRDLGYSRDGAPLGDSGSTALQDLVGSGRLSLKVVALLTQEALGGSEASAGPLSETREMPASRPPSSQGRRTSRGDSGAAAATGADGGEEDPVWGPYRDVSLLGEGGMAEVFKAYEPRLKRLVALKFLRVQHPELALRLLREAQMQARVEHPNICRVYDVGEIEGRPFIAMQYVEGPTLDKVASKMSLEQRVLALRDVAEALHAAHREGLIHRDLKPANILVEEMPDGRFRPYVTDFGLAKETAAPNLSQTGTITGTPQYMAPEQIRGDAAVLDRRTDVYGLGATLYEALALRPPFEGGTAMDVMVKVLADEPARLRQIDPSVPRDLETVVLKCLEKEPQRRYESAKALAEDLSRYLDGEPVSAQPATLLYRVAKKARKNRLLTAVSTGSLLAVLALGGLWLNGWWRASEAARLAQEFGRQTAQAEAGLRFGRLLPLHDTRTEREQVASRIGDIQAKMSALGRRAQAPGRAAVGRAYLALGEAARARENLDAAWKAGSRSPETACALGQAYGLLYKDALAQCARIPSKELRQAQTEQIRETLRAPALRYLQAGLGSRIDSPDYLKGLVALYEDRYEDALARARAAIGANPWLFEAILLEGDVYARRGMENQFKGDFDEALRDFGEAESAFTRASMVARSSTEAYLGLGLVGLHEMEVLEAGGRPLGEAFASARQAVDRALTADPASARAQTIRARSLMVMAQSLAAKGQDPVPTFQEAVAAGEAAVRDDPESPEALMSLGLCLFRYGEHISSHGEDPAPLWRRAADIEERALKVAPGEVFCLNALGLVWWRMGDFDMARGEDPRPSLERATRAFAQGLAVKPIFASQVNQANVYLTTGIYELTKGLDPTRSLDLAIDSYEKALALNPKMPQIYGNMASTHFKKAEYLMETGGDPGAPLEKALECCQKALALNPAHTNSYFTTGTVRLAQAVQAMKTGRPDPLPLFAKAREAAAKAVALKPGYYNFVRLQGEIEVYALKWARQSGAPPRTSLDPAEKILTSALVLNPNAFDTYYNLVELYLTAAEWPGTPPAQVRRYTRSGLDAAAQMLRLNPEVGDGIARKGRLLVVAAGVEPDPKVRSAMAAQALDTLSRAAAAKQTLAKDLEDYVERARRLSAPGF